MNYFPKVVIILILSGIFSNTNVELKVGESAPEFSLKDQNGVIHKLSDYRGKQVVIYFFPKAGTPG
jgi:peroxiredoxin Q/BCP